MKIQFPLIVLLFCYSINLIHAQTYEGKFLDANYDESKIPEYALPDILKSFDGKQIKTIGDWEKTRKPEIIHFFEQNIYGEVPTPFSPIEKSFEIM